ncbi:hypothetical protein SNEBB_009879 [Seison nebaliae]|nr:hypothetical protein SNEBB_009879 [Seison nebaliae]
MLKLKETQQTYKKKPMSYEEIKRKKDYETHLKNVREMKKLMNIRDVTVPIHVIAPTQRFYPKRVRADEVYAENKSLYQRMATVMTRPLGEIGVNENYGKYRISHNKAREHNHDRLMNRHLKETKKFIQSAEPLVDTGLKEGRWKKVKHNMANASKRPENLNKFLNEKKIAHEVHNRRIAEKKAITVDRAKDKMLEERRDQYYHHIYAHQTRSYRSLNRNLSHAIRKHKKRQGEKRLKEKKKQRETAKNLQIDIKLLNKRRDIMFNFAKEGRIENCTLNDIYAEHAYRVHLMNLRYAKPLMDISSPMVSASVGYPKRTMKTRMRQNEIYCENKNLVQKILNVQTRKDPHNLHPRALECIRPIRSQVAWNYGQRNRERQINQDNKKLDKKIANSKSYYPTKDYQNNWEKTKTKMVRISKFPFKQRKRLERMSSNFRHRHTKKIKGKNPRDTSYGGEGEKSTNAISLHHPMEKEENVTKENKTKNEDGDEQNRISFQSENKQDKVFGKKSLKFSDSSTTIDRYENINKDKGRLTSKTGKRQSRDIYGEEKRKWRSSFEHVRYKKESVGRISENLVIVPKSIGRKSKSKTNNKPKKVTLKRKDVSDHSIALTSSIDMDTFERTPESTSSERMDPSSLMEEINVDESDLNRIDKKETELNEQELQFKKTFNEDIRESLIKIKNSLSSEHVNHRPLTRLASNELLESIGHQLSQNDSNNSQQPISVDIESEIENEIEANVSKVLEENNQKNKSSKTEDNSNTTNTRGTRRKSNEKFLSPFKIGKARKVSSYEYYDNYDTETNTDSESDSENETGNDSDSKTENFPTTSGTDSKSKTDKNSKPEPEPEPESKEKSGNYSERESKKESKGKEEKNSEKEREEKSEKETKTLTGKFLEKNLEKKLKETKKEEKNGTETENSSEEESFDNSHTSNLPTSGVTDKTSSINELPDENYKQVEFVSFSESELKIPESHDMSSELDRNKVYTKYGIPSGAIRVSYQKLDDNVSNFTKSDVVDLVGETLSNTMNDATSIEQHNSLDDVEGENPLLTKIDGGRRSSSSILKSPKHQKNEVSEKRSVSFKESVTVLEYEHENRTESLHDEGDYGKEKDLNSDEFTLYL